jgi:tetratricopeptide (TPR) repeat protein
MSAETARALLTQAAACQRQGRHVDAVEKLQKALALDPDFAEGWLALGVAQQACGRYQEAISAFDAALERHCPRPHEAHLYRAVIFSDHLRRDEDAKQALQAALAFQPDYLPALLNLGNLLEQQGARDAALDCYQRVLQNPALPLQPDAALRGVALARSAIMRPPTSLDDPLLGQLRRALELTTADAQVRVHLYFALGHSLDRLQDSEGAFDAFSRGNRQLLRLHGRSYDRDREKRLTDALIEAFPAPASADPTATEGPEPLFICGMFRSGSTLAEQVLAAHPQVHGGGEVDWLLRLAAERMAPFPSSARSLLDDRAKALGQEYRDHLRQLFPEAEGGAYITDKRPDNYRIIGLIKRLLPAARIVHTVRHPIDNCLSVFMQHMNSEVTPYATDLADIGHHYGEYRRLMQHWQRLYPDSLYQFDYDEFVRTPRESLARLLEFLGLPWDERCLAFHQLRNTVKTASYWQVRRPLYAEASGRWRRYTKHLGPLLASFEASGIDPAKL